MARKLYYSRVISNPYLGVQKELKGATSYEVNVKAEQQLAKWRDQEKRQREREYIEDLKQQAEFDTSNANDEIEKYRRLLKNVTRVNCKLDWRSIEKHDFFKEFTFHKSAPDKNLFEKNNKVFKEYRWLEMILPFVKRERLKRKTKAESAYTVLLEKYNKDRRLALDTYNTQKENFVKEQNEHNQSIKQFKEAFESGSSDAVEKYLYLVLEKSEYPDTFDKNFEIQVTDETVIVSYQLPSYDFLPKTIQVKYISSKKELSEVYMKKKDYDEYYESVLYQICLRTINEVFQSVSLPSIQTVVFNGWITGTDKQTGNEFSSCLLSCQAFRYEFETFNLDRVDPKECFRKLKGLSAGPLAQLAPVRPILNLSREDKRFVESQEVLANLNSETNLATMDWQDFEHLVRELFSSEFSGENVDVKVTRASKDGGVDAVIFDPDPIKGGKIVIQAKRYNNIVPVTAVRDLFGTVMNEGATKGILVTTSYYGSDSYEFAKGKPLTLLTGNELLGLFQKHGHQVTIRLNK